MRDRVSPLLPSEARQEFAEKARRVTRNGAALIAFYARVLSSPLHCPSCGEGIAPLRDQLTAAKALEHAAFGLPTQPIEIRVPPPAIDLTMLSQKDADEFLRIWALIEAGNGKGSSVPSEALALLPHGDAEPEDAEDDDTP